MLIDRLGLALNTGHARTGNPIPGDGGATDFAADIVAAAVLIAVTNQAAPTVILTQRPDTMRKHPGQVAFPGGRVDPDDHDHVSAALREAEEEIALSPDNVTIIGITDTYRTITGYAITPVIGVIPPDLTLHANADEVDAIFEVPLAFLLDPANHSTKDAIWDRRGRTYYEINWEDRRIWGATAAMIVNLSRRLDWLS